MKRILSIRRIRLLVNVFLILCCQYSCKKDDNLSEIKRFPSKFGVINNSNEKLYFQINAYISYPDKNATAYIFKNIRFLSHLDTSFIISDTIYKGCSRQMSVLVSKNLTEISKCINRIYISKIEKIESIKQKDLFFKWPDDTIKYKLSKIDTLQGLNY